MPAPADTLLAWYDTHARDLPWRVLPHADIAPDPYKIWLSEVMLQQTTVAAVKSYFQTFTTRWPTVHHLAAAPDADVMAAWAGLGYYARARNLLKCARMVVDDFGGTFPNTEHELQKLPGIGPYTSAAIASIAFDQKATVLDGNVERVMARIHAVTMPLPQSKETLRSHAAAWTPDHRPGDYAQAIMDLGATICTPRSPACGICPWIDLCEGRKQGVELTLPQKTPKAKKPTRLGIAYVVKRDDGAFLLERRPQRGLLSGMLGWPTTDWAETPPTHMPPIKADWTTLNDDVRHTFTHFHLHLTVMTATVSQDAKAKDGQFFDTLDPSHLPTVMKKVWTHAVALH